jgi:glutathione synthase/RimK-type ligase-like ATP-grasp enzyme
MKRFLILGEQTDLHGNYVAWALREAGHDVRFINSWHQECPMRTTLYLDDTTDDFKSADWDGVEAAWTRRLPMPVAPSASHEENEGYMLREEQKFTRWLIEMQRACTPTRWINLPEAAIAAENKFVQLKTARSLGIRIPRTLVTSEPSRFRAFVEREKKVVAKPLSAFSWEYSSGETLSAFAAILDIRRASELRDEDIAQCVTMYQELIEKTCDVRMVALGESMFAFKIIQQGEQHFDFRVNFLQRDLLRYEPIPVPAGLTNKMTRLMRSMGVNFASADFALTAQGEFVFLDLNPSGQWLFIEKATPEVQIGSKFCSYFVNGSVRSDAGNLFPSLCDYIVSDAARIFEKMYQARRKIDDVSSDTWKEKRAS